MLVSYRTLARKNTEGHIWARSFRRLPRFYINLFSGAAAGESGREGRDGADGRRRGGVQGATRLQVQEERDAVFY